MLSFGVGDVVKLRNDLVVMEKYGCDTFVSGMTKVLGKKVTISRIRDDHQKFFVHECPSYNFTPQMIETKEKEIGGNDMKTYKVGIVPGEVYEVVVDDESTTVKELFEFAGLAIDDSYTIHRNGETISSSAKIENISTDVSFYAKKESSIKRETFIPHLRHRISGSHCGNIGEETEVEGPFGEKLYVGDVVELYDTVNGRNVGKRMICKDIPQPEGFVMGVASREFKNGNSSSFQIRKVKSYRHLSHDEIVDIIIIKMYE